MDSRHSLSRVSSRLRAPTPRLRSRTNIYPTPTPRENNTIKFLTLTVPPSNHPADLVQRLTFPKYPSSRRRHLSFRGNADIYTYTYTYIHIYIKYSLDVSVPSSNPVVLDRQTIIVPFETRVETSGTRRKKKRGGRGTRSPNASSSGKRQEWRTIGTGTDTSGRNVALALASFARSLARSRIARSALAAAPVCVAATSHTLSPFTHIRSAISPPCSSFDRSLTSCSVARSRSFSLSLRCVTQSYDDARDI